MSANNVFAASALFMASMGIALANPGEDGNQTFTSGTTVINAYAALNATANAGATSFSVLRSQITQLALPAAACPTSTCTTALQVGDLLMVYQPQGATMTTDDTSSYGNVTNYGSAGLYEFVYVSGTVPSSAGTQTDVVTLTFSTSATNVPCTGLRNTYTLSTSAGVAPPMLIRVPQYRNLTVNNGATLVAAQWAWNSGTTGLGGVLAADVRDISSGGIGTATINGVLSASGRGFRGGTDIANQSDTDNNSSSGYRNTPGSSLPSADKGESIVGSITRYNNLNGRAGRGAPANGGGGGSGHNGAGGGGSNAGSPAPGNANSYGGSLGIPNLNGSADPGGTGAGYMQAWCLDPVIGNGTTSCTSLNQGGGGGRGGYTWAQYYAPSPFTTVPGNTAWGGNGDSRRYNFGGLGGRPLDSGASSTQRVQTYARLFFGGGGGAGDANNNGGTGSGWAGTGCGATGGSNPGAPPNNGGNGGGLVYLITERVLGSGSVSATGSAGDDSCGVSGEGPAGGGGGGSVVISTSSSASILPAGLQVSAVGGAGGDQTNADTSRGTNCANAGTDCEAQGGGGGGGGGVILAPGGGSKSVAGGDYGITLAATMQGVISGTTQGRFYPNGATTGVTGTTAAPPPRTGGPSPFTCLEGPGFSTPVSAAYFHAIAEANGLRVRFDTAAEIGNLGFRIAAVSPRDRSTTQTALIASQSAFSDGPRSYESIIDAEITDELYLLDIDLQGRERRHGPYQVGQVYGQPLDGLGYDWSSARAANRAYQTSVHARVSSVAKVGLNAPGMYRISYQDLANAGVYLDGLPSDEIALISRTGAMARQIDGGREFGTDSAIVFYADPHASLWSRDEYLLIKHDPAQARPMAVSDLPAYGSPQSTQRVSLRHAPQVGYDPASPVGDPWYAKRLLAQGSSVSTSVSLNGAPAVTGEASLSVLLWGGIDWEGDQPDHSVRILVNGAVVAERRWFGISTEQIQLPLTGFDGNATVIVEALGDTGYAADVVYLESIQIDYVASARGNGAAFHGIALSTARSESIFADGNGDEVVRLSGSVGIADVAGEHLRAFSVYGNDAVELRVDPRNGGIALYAEQILGDATIWVGEDRHMLIASLVPIVEDVDLLSGTAQWLAISHGQFLSALTPLTQLRQSEGLSTKVVDVEAIYARYSAGNPDPEAIRQYLRDAQRQLGTRYAVLVGADTVDAPGYLNSGSLSFIPTPYVATSLYVHYAPADAALGDGDGDGYAELVVGRLPVRNLAEADEAVRKIVAYAQQPASGRLLLVAGANDVAANANFATDSDEFNLRLNAPWQRSAIYQNSTSLTQARTDLVDAFNSGQSLISYMGHSGPTRWTFDPLFTTSQVTGSHSNPALRLSNSSDQPIVLQFACWTTYFVSAQQNSMAQVLLTTPYRGASAVLGASVLMSQSSHQQLASAIAPLLSPGTRIGDALRDAKLAVQKDPLASYRAELQLAQIILGDPAQIVR